MTEDLSDFFIFLPAVRLTHFTQNLKVHHGKLTNHFRRHSAHTVLPTCLSIALPVCHIAHRSWRSESRSLLRGRPESSRGESNHAAWLTETPRH